MIYWRKTQITFLAEPTHNPVVNSELFSSLLATIKHLNSNVNDLETLFGIQHLCSISPHLEVDFSSRCNLRCPMCHQSKLDMGKFQLDGNAVNTLIDSLPARETVMIAGLGEPLLYPALDRFLKYAALFQCRTHLFTNGQLIHRKLAELRQVERISVSLDGATRETFETLRRGARFTRVCRNIELLRKAAPETMLVTSTVVSRVNVEELAAIVTLAESLGMDEVHFSAVDHTEALSLRPQDRTVFEQQLTKARGQRIKIRNNVLPRHFEPDRNSRISALDHQLAASLAVPLPRVEPLPEPKRPPPIIDSHIQHLAAAEQVNELQRRAAALKTRYEALLAMLPGARPSLPYCSIPWGYAFAQSNGFARLCPYAEVAAGAISEVLGGEYNSPLLDQVRGSMRAQTRMLHVCQRCTDEHRQFRRVALTEALARISKPVPRWHRRIMTRISRIVRRKAPPSFIAGLKIMRALARRAPGKRDK